MDSPLWSTLTLVTELAVTASVFSVIWRGYRTGRFMTYLAAGTLTYELLFNVSYMASRELRAAAKPVALNPYLTGLAIFHGVFSLVMFAALITFFALAWRGYRAGQNYFAVHPRLTRTFVGAWSVSILSGILLFADLYLL